MIQHTNQNSTDFSNTNIKEISYLQTGSDNFLNSNLEIIDVDEVIESKQQPLKNLENHKCQLSLIDSKTNVTVLSNLDHHRPSLNQRSNQDSKNSFLTKTPTKLIGNNLNKNNQKEDQDAHKSKSQSFNHQNFTQFCQTIDNYTSLNSFSSPHFESKFNTNRGTQQASVSNVNLHVNNKGTKDDPRNNQGPKEKEIGNGSEFFTENDEENPQNTFDSVAAISLNQNQLITCRPKITITNKEKTQTHDNINANQHTNNIHRNLSDDILNNCIKYSSHLPLALTDQNPSQTRKTENQNSNTFALGRNTQQNSDFHKLHASFHNIDDIKLSVCDSEEFLPIIGRFLRVSNTEKGLLGSENLTQQGLKGRP